VPRASIPPQPSRSPDPSEEITPEELATIPEPVQPGAGQTQAQPPEAARSPSRAPAAPVSDDSSQAVWRVQVFASQDLQLADRKGKEAAERLQVRAYLVFEAPYYKVRLGDFPTEEKAQALREQAISAGYPGAFRTRCSRDITQDGQ